MKTIKKLSIIFFTVVLSIPVISLAQNTGLDKKFTFNENSKKETFTFDIKEGTKELTFDFEGDISKGCLRVKIYDPEGNQVSGFSLEASKSKDKGYATSVTSIGSSKKGSSARASSRSSSSSSYASSSSSSSSSNSVSVEADESGETKTTKRKTHIYTKEKTETNESGARGVINKEITNPPAGTWEFTIYPEDTEGNLSAKIMYK